MWLWLVIANEHGICDNTVITYGSTETHCIGWLMNSFVINECFECANSSERTMQNSKMTTVKKTLTYSERTLIIMWLLALRDLYTSDSSDHRDSKSFWCDCNRNVDDRITIVVFMKTTAIDWNSWILIIDWNWQESPDF